MKNNLKAKPLGTFRNKFGTRKSHRCRRGDHILPRSDNSWYWQTNSGWSRRRKHLLNIGNRKIRRYKGDISSGGNYKRIYDFQWELY